MTEFADEAVAAIKQLDKAGAPSFITCESSPGFVPKVVASFDTIEQSHAFHRALIQCGQVARMMEAEEQAFSVHFASDPPDPATRGDTT